MPPVVGITQCLDDRGRWRRGRRYHYADAAYARAVERAGGLPLYLPVQADVGALIERIDALLVPGGDDLPPERPYPAEVCFDLAPAAQVEFDRRLLAAALERRLPFLGICYGMQILALVRGGALHHHLPIDLPGAAPHRLPEPDGRHALRIEPGTRLAAILGPSPVSVNSLHHQAVAVPGEGLRVSARGEDDVIEAVEAPGAVFCLGVQWHPEKLDPEPHGGVFRALVEACGARGDA
jgi:putative glutamine amidotransferase